MATVTAIPGLRADLLAGIRLLATRPAFSAMAVLTLGLGIAVNSTVFGWIDSVLLRPVPGATADHELVAVEEMSAAGETHSVPHPDYRDFQTGCDRLSGLAATHLLTVTVGSGESARRMYGQVVSANFFSVLGVRVPIGRAFSAAEDRDVEGAYPYAVISDRLWRSYFRGDPAVVGKPVRMNGQLLTIVGVAAPEFAGSTTGLALDVWAHLSTFRGRANSASGSHSAPAASA